jgi:hypothetical protein
MEYLLGSLVTVALFFITRRIFNSTDSKDRDFKIVHSQSYVYSLVKPLLNLQYIVSNKTTQASKYLDSLYVRVVIAENKAYWITGNTFFVADEEDGFVDKDTAKPVDVMSMDDVQLKKMMFIVETLTEGAEDEDRNSGNKKF